MGENKKPGRRNLRGLHTRQSLARIRGLCEGMKHRPDRPLHNPRPCHRHKQVSRAGSFKRDPATINERRSAWFLSLNLIFKPRKNLLKNLFLFGFVMDFVKHAFPDLQSASLFYLFSKGPAGLGGSHTVRFPVH